MDNSLLFGFRHNDCLKLEAIPRGSFSIKDPQKTRMEVVDNSFVPSGVRAPAQRSGHYTRHYVSLSSWLI